MNISSINFIQIIQAQDIQTSSIIISSDLHSDGNRIAIGENLLNYINRTLKIRDSNDTQHKK